ncbi:hypothetical protein PF011_g31290 [Phytophthora fragariae]|uniref:Uncharacterized protein n=2 Tax=Phytophthora fragariae TaxID=53985 RepID=A0A6A3GID5_9STRA|nr:hypothetical protein PF011_g31290 [Phytophthora fragariae]
MAQNDSLFETTSVRQQQHPLLRPSVIMYDDLSQSSMRSQSNYNIFNSTRQLPVMAEPNMGESCPADFVSVSIRSMALPQISHRGADAPGQQTNMRRPSVSSQALHDMFNLQRLSDSHVRPNIMRLYM